MQKRRTSQLTLWRGQEGRKEEPASGRGRPGLLNLHLPPPHLPHTALHLTPLLCHATSCQGLTLLPPTGTSYEPSTCLRRFTGTAGQSLDTQDLCGAALRRLPHLSGHQAPTFNGLTLNIPPPRDTTHAHTHAHEARTAHPFLFAG